MSATCWIVYADSVVTRMTVWSSHVDDLDIGRALYLAHCAYESRMKRSPPERDITIAGKTYRLPHILGLRHQLVDGSGKTYDMSEGELVRTLILGMIFSGPKP